MLRDAIAAKLPPRAGDLVSRASPGSLLTAAIGVLLVVVVAVIVVTRHHGAATGASPPYSYSGEASADPTDSPAPAGTDFGATESIVVDVGGRVRKPGLVTLPVGARVADAIDAAGGPLKPRELDRIDLAQRVTDGQLLLIGVSPSASDAAGDSASSSGTDPSTPISLSTATIDQLETLPGVGPVTAQKMIDWRTAHGGFTTVEQLQQVPGIGPAHYAEISPLVTP
jgi:competence protein ComEA